MLINAIVPQLKKKPSKCSLLSSFGYGFKEVKAMMTPIAEIEMMRTREGLGGKHAQNRT